MSGSKLGQVLECFERSPGGMSLPALARELDLSRSQAQNLIEFWVRKGRLRLNSQEPDCQRCGSKMGCPFILEMPRYYELILEDE